MTKKLQPEIFYNEQIEKLNSQLNPLKRKRKVYGWLRFICALAAIAFLWHSITAASAVSLIPFAAFFGLFLFIFSLDIKNSETIKNLETLLQINQQEIQILEHQFHHLPTGDNFKPANHAYANDIDIFGKASLYQYINRTNSEQGQACISDWLLKPATPHIILQRQEAVKELAQKTRWRQQLQAYGIHTTITKKTEKRIADWLGEKNNFSGNIWKAASIILPAIALTMLVLHIVDIISSGIFYPLVLLFAVIAFGISKKVMPVYLQLNKITSEIDSLSYSAGIIEKENFTSQLLLTLQQSFVQNNNHSSKIIKQLKASLGRFDYRMNPLVFIPLNIFLFWDLQQILILEKWKTTNKSLVSLWFSSLAQFESLSSFGNLSFNHPQWIFPELDNKKGTFIAELLGHPLIQKEKCVNNSFSTEGTNKINLITGSNMAGKSTFLRSVGVNIVLAMAGSVVCAEKMRLYPTKVLSTMRVTDNLEENTSTFYAELKKLKEIIEAVYNQQEVFLLLDEILRGTNSLDRHTGSKALVKQLIHHNAAGLLATHDLELAKMEDEYPGRIMNYHFDVQVSNEELYFDYKLKRGVCQSMNASILMKKIGIEL